MSSYSSYMELTSPVSVEPTDTADLENAVDSEDRDLGIRVHRLRIDGSDPISLFAHVLRKLCN